MNDDDEQKGYTWEVDYAEGLNIREVLREDESGSIEKSIAKLVLDAKRKKRVADRPAKVRLGIMRYVYIVIDCSFSMTDKSLLPTRLSATIKALNQFLDKFSEQNPISQVGIIICKDKRAERLIPLTGNVRLVKESLSTITEALCHGEFSLHNSLMTAIRSLHSYPGHASREVILVVASLSTCDPSSIFGTFELLKRYHMRCSVISLSAEVFVFKKLCTTTSGHHSVVLDNTHFEVVLNEHTNPPTSVRNTESSVVRMGFPAHEIIDCPSFCLCHQSEIRSPNGRGFFCPQCGARYCSLPVECRICKLILISAPQLARSLHNLLPLPAFEEVDTTAKKFCFACLRQLDEKSFVCKACKSMFCIDCDVLLHESLQICPGWSTAGLYYDEEEVQWESVEEAASCAEKTESVRAEVLGTRTASSACGTPGLSKKKAFENRAKTLAVEWKERAKRNKIVDQRIGEGDALVAEEERISKRFATERLKLFKTNKSQLTDDADAEQLMHKGRALTEVEKYDRTMLSDEDDDELEGGNIDADVVAAAHFGGGAGGTTGGNAASRRQDVLAELIAKTKQHRYDKKLARDERDDETSRLDEKWKEMLQTGAMASFSRPLKDRPPNIRREADDYDSLFFELQADIGKRGEASDRQKTQEEIAHEERERLIRQEKARLLRMEQNDTNELQKLKDGENKNDQSFMVRYDRSGALISPEKVKRGRIKIVRIGSVSSSDEEKEDASEGDEIGEHETVEDDFDAMVQGDDENTGMCPASCSSQNDASSSETKAVKKSANEELPFVIAMPEKFENLKQLMDAHSGPDWEAVIVRLIKLYHPNLREGNKSRLCRLFIFLLRYYDNLSKEGATETANSLGYIARGLYALMKINVEYSVRCMRALLRQQYTLHERAPRTIFTFRVISLMKLISILYHPFSDAFHPVVCPALAFACRLISTVRICNIKHAARVLIMIRIIVSFVEESKRYLPEVIAFLHGVLLMAVESTDDERSPTVTFPVSLPHRRMLFVTDKCSATVLPSQMDAAQVFNDDFESFEENDRNRLCVLHVALDVLCRFGMIYSNNINFAIIFGPLLDLLSRLPRDRYPNQFVDDISSVESFISAQCSKNSLKQLQRSEKEKKMLTMLEPRFEEGYDAEKAHYHKNSANKSKKIEIKQLTKKYKKELRGTVRELRRDNQFLNREKKREIVENDRARRRKTKWLISTLQGQESEYKKNAYMKHRL